MNGGRSGWPSATANENRFFDFFDWIKEKEKIRLSFVQKCMKAIWADFDFLNAIVSAVYIYLNVRENICRQ